MVSNKKVIYINKFKLSLGRFVLIKIIRFIILVQEFLLFLICVIILYNYS